MLTYHKIGKNGRFGNQLFQIAATIGIALSCGDTYGFAKWDYQDYFINKLPKVEKNAESLNGYLQDYRYFDQEDVKKYFAMRPIAEPLNKVFIHFRAYSDEGVEQIHPEQTRDYYTKAIKHFEGSEFVVFSDNVDKAKDVVGVDCEYICNDEMQDFYQMTTCKGAIISNSSYAWWGAYLCGGKVVAPANWFGGRKKDKKTDGYYLPGWIVL